MVNRSTLLERIKKDMDQKKDSSKVQNNANSMSYMNFSTYKSQTGHRKQRARPDKFSNRSKNQLDNKFSVSKKEGTLIKNYLNKIE